MKRWGLGLGVGGWVSLHETLRVCLVGVKTGGWKIGREKYDGKMTFFTIWFRRENKRDRK